MDKGVDLERTHVFKAGKKYIKNIERFVNITTKHPFIVVFLFSILTLMLLSPAWNFQENIESDVEIYIPEDDPSRDILLEIREEWTTDTILIYVETDNAYHPDTSTKNITDREILLEMTKIEGDDDYGKNEGALDWDKKDRGKNDNIIFVLSISTIIKELNSTTPRFINAVEKQLEYEFPLYNASLDDEQVEESGKYSIPSQERIDELVNQTSASLKKMVIDTNNDTIWDTAIIIFAVNHEVDKIEMLNLVQDTIDARENPKTTMTITGLLAVLQDITDRVYEDLLKMMPLAFGLVIFIMWFFHRTFKILLIVGIPTIFTMIWTFGLLKALDLELTPMVVAAGPILIGLCVDDALHITNRIEEFKKEGFNERKSIAYTFVTTGRAVLLTTITTIIGFSVLYFSEIIPMRTVGLTLFIGIATAFLLTILLVPNLILILGYKKRPIPMWKKIGTVPIKHKWIVLLIVIVITSYSVIKISVLSSDIRGDESAPEGIASLDKIKQYSERFKAGQTGMVIVRGDKNADEPVKDKKVLDAINETQTDIDKVKNTTVFSIVDFFKSIQVNSTRSSEAIDQIPLIPEPIKEAVKGTLNQFIPLNFSGSLWDLIHLDPYGGEAINWEERVIEISYDTLSDEVRSMLINRDYTKTLIYIEMPYLNLKLTEKLVYWINRAVDNNTQSDEFKNNVPNGGISHLAGGAPVSIAINNGIHDTQKLTIYLSLFLVFLVLLFLFRSLKMASLAMLPLFTVVLWQPLLMVGADANVNIFTAMIGTIVIGIGIDFSIHMSERIREEGETYKGIAKATEGTGQSLVEASGTTAMALFAGLLITLTSFAGLRTFFMMILVLILYSLFAGLILLPSIYAILLDFKKIRKGESVGRIGRLKGKFSSKKDIEWDDED